MSRWIDYHVHTDNSSDCRIPMNVMCAAAVENGVREIAFTDHFNNHMLDIDLGFYDPDRYFADIERCRAAFPSLIIRTGIEVGEPHRWARKILPVLTQYPYDVVLGSLHWCGNDSMFNPNYFRARPPERAFGDYFEELIRMIHEGGFDILAHIDLPKRVGFDVYGDFDIRGYEDVVRRVWEACIDQRITPEINTKGLRCTVNQLHPTGDALRWYAEMGGQQLSLGSDAHRPENIGDGFELARQSAVQVGLTRVCRYEARAIVEWVDL